MYQSDIETDTTDYKESVDFNTKADLVYDQRDQGETIVRC